MKKIYSFIIAISLFSVGCNSSGGSSDSILLGQGPKDANSIDGHSVQAPDNLTNQAAPLVYDQTSKTWVEKQLAIGDITGLNTQLNTESATIEDNQNANNQTATDLQNKVNQKVNTTQYSADQISANNQVTTLQNNINQKVDSNSYNTDKTNTNNQVVSLQNQVNQKADQTATTNALAQKLDKTGGKLTGDLQLNNKNSTQEATSVSSMTALDSGKTWFNSIVGELKFWNGSQVKEVSTVDEVALKANSADLGALAYKTKISDSDVSDVSASKVTGQISDSQIQGVAGSKVSGDIAGNSAGINNNIGENQVNNLQADLNSKLNKTGGTLTGDLQVYVKDSGTETTQSSTLTLADQAKIWFNSTIDKLKVWSGSSVKSVATDDEFGSLAYKNTVGDADITAVGASKVTGQISDSQIQGVSGSKVSGNIPGFSAGLTNNIATSLITGLSDFVTNLVNFGTQNRTTNQSSSSITLLNSDAEFLAVTTSAVPVTVTLPSSPVKGRVFNIKDASGNANVNNITVSGNGINIDGKPNYVINSVFGGLNLVYNSNQWLISYPSNPVSSSIKVAPIIELRI